MVNEIIHVQIGQCRNMIGNALWNTMSAEHKLVKDGKFSGNTEAGELDEIYATCGILVDLEPASLELIKASPIDTMLKADNFVFGASGTSNNWIKGHYTELKGAESCDCQATRIPNYTFKLWGPYRFMIWYFIINENKR